MSLPWGWISAFALSVLIISNAASVRWGYGLGEDAADARHTAAVAKLESDLREVSNQVLDAEVARLKAERERNDLLAELNAEGDASPDAGSIALPSRSVSRINAIGGR